MVAFMAGGGMNRGWWPASAAVLLVALASPSAAQGVYSQLAGSDACVRQPHGPLRQGVCAAGKGLLGAHASAMSPDGRHLYVASTGSGAVSVLARHPSSGALTWVACVSDDGTTGVDGTDGECAGGSGLRAVSDVTVTRDGASVYTTSRDGAVATFARDQTTGMLTQRGCIREAGPHVACTDGYGLAAAEAVEVSPDGEIVYVASGGSDLAVGGGSGALATFDRDPATGDLRQVGCTSYDGSDGACADGYGLRGASGIAVSPDGRHLYVAARESEALTVFRVNRSTAAARQVACLMGSPPDRGPCRPSPGLGEASAVAVSPSGRRVYATSPSGTLSWLRRNPSTGGLTPHGCLGDPDAFFDEFEEGEEEEAEAPCRESRLLGGAADVAVAPDGRVGVAAADDGAFAVFRSGDRGVLELDSCARRGGRQGCSRAVGLAGASSLAFSQDGRNAYLTASPRHAVVSFEDDDARD